MSSAVSAVTSGFNSVTSGIFGSGSDAGILGTGQFKAGNYNIDANAFNNATSDADRARALGQADTMQARGDQTFNQGQQARGQQAALADALNAQMRGEGPSLAQGQLRAATDRNVAQQAGLAASNRNVNPALAARMQGQNTAMANQQAAGDSAQLRAAEQLSAQQQAGTLAGQMRSGDQAANAEANTNQRAQQQAAIDLSEQNRAAKIAKEQLEVQKLSGVNQVNASAYEGASGRRGDMVSNIGGGLMAAFSDADMKTEIEPGGVKTQEFLDSIAAGVDSGGSGDGGVAEQAAQAKAAREEKKAQQQQQMMQMASMAAMAMSDEDNKSKVKSGADKTNSFLTKFADQLNGGGGSSGGSMSAAQKKSKGYQDIGKGLGKMMGGQQGGGSGGIAGMSGSSGAGASSGGGLASLLGSGGGGAASGAGAAAAASDERLKIEIKGSDPKVMKFLDAIKAHEYEYKESAKDLPGAGEGKHVSPMAQELEKSELGKQMVIDTPNGKMVDYGKGFGTILAAQAMLNKRLNELESKKKGK